MILVCPECSTNYELPNQLPEGGAKVRCTECSHTWQATNESLMEAVPDPESEVAAVPQPEEAVEDEDIDEIPALSPTDEIFEEIDATDSDDLVEENGQEDIDSLFDDFEFPDDEEAGADAGGLDGLFDTEDEVTEPEVAEIAAEPEEASDGGEENSQDDIDGLFDEAGYDAGEENGQDDIDSLFDEDDAGEDNSQDDIDGLFDDAPDMAADVEEAEEFEASADEELDDPFDNPLIEAEEEEVPSPVEPLAALPFWKRVDRRVMAGWAGYASAILLFILVMIVARVSVVSVAPAMASIYSAIGLPVNVRGIVFTNVQQRWRNVGGQIQLQVEGEIANQTNSYKPLPSIIIGGLSSDRREVFRWVAKVRDKPLLPGEKAPFIADIPAPPETTKHLLLRFEDK